MLVVPTTYMLPSDPMALEKTSVYPEFPHKHGLVTEQEGVAPRLRGAIPWTVDNTLTVPLPGVSGEDEPDASAGDDRTRWFAASIGVDSGPESLSKPDAVFGDVDAMSGDPLVGLSDAFDSAAIELAAAGMYETSIMAIRNKTANFFAKDNGETGGREKDSVI
jgi:hypothetical protein